MNSYTYNFFYLGKFWKAPELIENSELPLTKETDVYSYSIIMYEICTRGDPYQIETEQGEWEPRGTYLFIISSYFV